MCIEVCAEREESIFIFDHGRIRKRLETQFDRFFRIDESVKLGSTLPIRNVQSFDISIQWITILKKKDI